MIESALMGPLGSVTTANMYQKYVFRFNEAHMLILIDKLVGNAEGGSREGGTGAFGSGSAAHFRASKWHSMMHPNASWDRGAAFEQQL